MITSTNSSPRQGNALLISLLLMSVLILITTGLARLVTSETRQIGSMMRNGQAEYLAEGGTELAQFIFYNIEPGNESTFDGKYSISFGDDNSKEIEVSLIGTTNHIPVRSSEVFQNARNQSSRENLELLFQPLLPGQSVEIPLEDGKEFEVEYYIETINLGDLEGQFDQADLDVLLFRLSGVPTGEHNVFNVNFITQYFPAGAPAGSRLLLGETPSQPASICSEPTGSDCFNGGTFFEFSNSVNESEDRGFTVIGSDDHEEGPTLLDIDFSGDDTLGDPQRTFQRFLNEHNNNIITMTNAINLAQIQNLNPAFTDPTQFNRLQEALGAIYFRVCSPNCAVATTTNASPNNQTISTALTSPFVAIESVGTYRNTQKILFTELSRPTALSVFDFAIFQVGTGPGT